MYLRVKIMLLFLMSFLVRAAALFAALTLCMMAINNIIQLAPKIINQPRYEVLKNYEDIFISPNVDMSVEGQCNLDKQLTAFFKETNTSHGLLFSLESQMEIYNGYFDAGLKKEDLKLTDYAISVNNNYLRINPAYDVYGNPVFADEDKLEFTILVPEKYKDKEKELFEHYTRELTFLNYYTDNLEKLGIAKAHEAVHDPLPVKIVFTKNEQKFFMYSASYGKYINDFIKDPIIKIVTTKNVSTPQIPNYITAQKYILNINNNEKAINDSLQNTGLKESVFKTRISYASFSNLLKKTILIILVQLVLISIAMAIAILFARLVTKKASKKHALWLFASWGITIVPLLVWQNINVVIYFGVVLVLIVVDALFLLRNKRVCFHKVRSP